MMFRRTIAAGAALAMCAAAGPLGLSANTGWAQEAKQFPSETYSGGPQSELERQFPDDQWEKKGVGINPGRFEGQAVGIDPGKAKPRGPGVFAPDGVMPGDKPDR